MLDYDNACSQSLAANAAVLDTLLAALFGDGGVPGQIHAFRIGWTRRFSDELSRRMAWLSHDSAQWKAVLAKRSELGPGDHGGVSAFVGRLIREQGLLREIEQSLRKHGAIVVSARAEKPFVGVASMTRSEDWLQQHGVAPDQLLPVDAIVWLVFSRAADAAPQQSSPVTRP